MTLKRHSKSLYIVFLGLLAFQIFGLRGLAAPAAQPNGFQQEGAGPTLSCACSSTNVQAVLLIDDSGSMQLNDPMGTRNQLAMGLVDRLAALQGDRDMQVQDIQVAVIHFAEDVIKDSDWINIDPGSDSWLYELKDQVQSPSLDNPADKTTSFISPLRKAAALFNKGDCIYRSIVLFTDGTPEDETGRLTGDRLRQAFVDLRDGLDSQGQETSGLDGIYLIAFRVSSNYWNDEVRTRWSDLLKNLSGIEEKLVTSQDEVPRFAIYSSQELLNQWFSRDQLITTETEGLSQTKINFDELSKYNDLAVKFDSESDHLQQGKQSEIIFKLVNNSGAVVMPGGDLAKILTPGADTPSSSEWNISITPLSQEIPLDITQDGDHYRFSWTPDSSGKNKFKIAYSLVDDQREILSCSGIVSLSVDPIPPAALSLVVGPPGNLQNNSITLPIELKYEGERSSLRWSIDATATDSRTGRRLNAIPDLNDTNSGTINLKIEPIDDARKIDVAVSAKAHIGSQDIPIPKALLNIPIDLPLIDLIHQLWPLLMLLIASLILISLPKWGRKGIADQNQPLHDQLRDDQHNPPLSPVFGPVSAPRDGGGKGIISTKGWEGWFRVTTQLVGDREIDIDDRGARLMFTIDLDPQLPKTTILENLHVVLNCTSDGLRRNIAINGMTAGQLVLFDRKDGHILRPGKSLRTELNISTGVFSTRKVSTESAEAGLKEYEVEIEYDLAPGTIRTDIVTQGLLFFQISKD